MTILNKIFARKPTQNDRFDGIQMGDRAADTISGFTGIVVALNSNISGCDQVCIQPRAIGKTFEDGRWFDVERVAVLEEKCVSVADRRTGADETPPSRTSKKTPS